MGILPVGMMIGKSTWFFEDRRTSCHSSDVYQLSPRKPSFIHQLLTEYPRCKHDLLFYFPPGSESDMVDEILNKTVLPHHKSCRQEWVETRHK